MTRSVLLALSVFTASAANLIENSSFEAGDLHGWSFGGATDPVRTPLYFTNIAARTGGKGMQLEYSGLAHNPAQIVSRGYRLKPGTIYTLSAYLKANPTNTAVNHAYMYPVNLADNSLGHQGQAKDNYKGAGFSITTNWVRYTSTFSTTTNLQALSYAIHIHSHWGVASHIQYTNQFFYIDDVQLEEASAATSYSPINPVEVGGNIVRSKAGHLFYDTDTLALDFTSYNNTGGAASRTVAYEVRDLWNSVRTNGSFSVSPGAGASVTNQLTLTGMPYGWFRCTYWITNQPGSLGEVQFSKMFQPISLSNRTNSFFGAHFLDEPWFLGAAQRAGFHWNRHFSVEREGNTIEVSPTEGSLTVYTQRVALNRTYDIEPYMMMGPDSLISRGALMGPEIPDWMTNSINYWVDTNKWRTWVTNFVSNYKDYVTYYGVWNELVENQTNANKYPDVLKWASQAIRQSDPTAGVVVAGDDYYAPAMSTVLNLLGSSTINIWSTHLYNYGQAGDDSVYNYERTNITAHVGRAWQTEAGLRTESGTRSQFWEDLFPEGVAAYPDGNGYLRDSRMRAQQMAHMFYYSARDPFQVWFYYDARTTAGLDNIIHYSLFDYDMTFRPTALMFAYAAQQLEEATRKGRFSVNSKVDSYWWVKAGIAGIVMWPTNNDEVPTILGTDGSGGELAARKLKLVSTLATNLFRVRDMFGNIVQYPVGGYPFGMDPIYIEAAGGTGTNALLGSLSISTNADVVAPVLQIITTPQTNNFSGLFQFRWNAVDDISPDVRWNGSKTNWGYTYQVNTNAIQYRTWLAPIESGYGAWTNTSWRLITNLTWDANSVFYVQARDAAGNVTTASVGSGEAPPSSNTGTGTSGVVRLRGLVNIRVQ